MSSRDIANLRQGLVAAWIPSLGSTGYRLVDRVGSNHGVLTGMDASDWVMSGNGMALDFDGSNDVVLVQNAQSLVITTGVTVSAWIYPKTVGGAYRMIACKRVGGGPPTSCNYQLNLHNSAGALEWYNLTEYISSYIPPTNTWTHVAGTVSEGGKLDLWANGVSVYSTTGVTRVADTGLVHVGARPGDYNESFNGQLDDIRIYNRALSATEVSLLSKERGIGFKTSSRTSSVFAKRYAYKPPKDKTYAAITRSQSDYDSLREGLVLAICPSVSGATGYRAVDVSGRGNHGTLTNMTPEDWVVGGGALSLDFTQASTRDYVNFGDVAHQPNDFTISGWVYKTVATTVTVNIWYLTRWNTGASPGTNEFCLLIGRGDGPAGDTAELIIEVGTTQYFVRSATNLTINKWQHITGVRRGSDLEIYIDGKNEGTTVAVATPLTNRSRNLRLGDSDISVDIVNNFRADDVRMYNRALTVPEIRRLASGRGVGLKPTSTQFDYIETREKTYSVIVKSQQEHSSLSEGLVGAWCPSLGATGYRLIDRSGYGNHGTLTNMTNDDWVVSGGALSLDFDGSNDFVPLSMTNTSSLTASIWVYSRNINNANGEYFVVKWGGSLNNDFYLGAFSNNWIARSGNSSGGQSSLLQSAATANRWTHLLATRDEATLRLYVDGLEKTSTSSSGFQGGGSAALELSRLFTFYANCQLDDIRIYNRALTPPEIRHLASKRGIGLRSQKQTMFYQFPSGSKRRRLLTGMP